MPSVAVIGASNARQKYGNKAVRAYLRQGWTVFPVNPNETTVEGLPAFARVGDIPVPVDRAALYVPPAVGESLLDELQRKGIKELFVNPGAESDALLERAERLGLGPIAACAIIDIGGAAMSAGTTATAAAAAIVAPAVSNMLELIGGTPLVRLRHLPRPGSADVFVKCEQFNPGGSVKDRVALAMIEQAERAGKLVPGKSVIVEPTSGSTGVGLALVSAVKRYRLILTMPDNMSIERRMLLKTYGAEVILTPAATVMRGAVERAVQLCAENPDYVMPQQFKNPANVEAHLRSTGPEIEAQLEELGRGCDAFIAGVGTGGTITGVGRVLRRKFPAVQVVAVEPEKSAVLSGRPPGEHRIDGIGAGFVPEILDRSVISEVRTISEQDAQACKLALAEREGLLVGISSGAAVKIALDVAQALGPGRTVVTVLPDTGERYFSTDEFFKK